jgi:hypothetical protein
VAEDVTVEVCVTELVLVWLVVCEEVPVVVRVRVAVVVAELVPVEVGVVIWHSRKLPPM